MKSKLFYTLLFLAMEFTVFPTLISADAHEGNHQYRNGFCMAGECTETYEPAILVTINNWETLELNENFIGYYAIQNAGQLFWYAQQINNGRININGTLTSDIILNPDYTFNTDGTYNTEDSPRQWIPIGTYMIVDENPEGFFTGVFDGNHHTISGLYCNTEADYVGLFGSISSDAIICNVTTVNSYIKGENNIGSVCGASMGNIMNCNNSGTVSATSFGGGVCGGNFTTISSCSNTGTVSGIASIGGVCGGGTGSITDCYNTGMVSGSEYTGGVCGFNTSTEDSTTFITDCYNSGTVSGVEYIGGVCGINSSMELTDAIITNCYNTGMVDGNSSIGGVCGMNSKSIINCYNSGSVSGTSSLGGVCGTNSKSIIDCYNTGTVTGGDESMLIGGICGFNTSTETSNAIIMNCYNFGLVCGTSYDGDMCGYSTGNITNCYYLGTSESEDALAGTFYKTVTEFENGSVAWLLNTAGKNQDDKDYSHSGVWSQGTSYPIFADETNKAVYQLNITGAVTETLYMKSGDFTPESILITDLTVPVEIIMDKSYTADMAITSAQPVLGSSITMTYYANIKTSLLTGNIPQMVFSHHGRIYNVEGIAGITVEDYTPYTFDFTGITPQCMGDDINASLTLEGKTVRKTAYSLKSYCDTMLSKSNLELAEMLEGSMTATVIELRSLLSDILLYGAASQTYTGYKINKLVGNLSQLSFAPLVTTDKVVNGTKNENAYFTAAGLWFENINRLYWKVSVSDENLSKLSVKVFRDNSETPCGTELSRFSDGVYIVYSENINATDFGVKYKAVITYDSTEAQTATYSVNSYVYSKQNEKTPIGTLVKALYKYGASSVAYTTKQEGE